MEICLEPYPRRRTGILGPDQAFVLFDEFPSYVLLGGQPSREDSIVGLSSSGDDFSS